MKKERERETVSKGGGGEGGKARHVHNTDAINFICDRPQCQQADTDINRNTNRRRHSRSRSRSTGRRVRGSMGTLHRNRDTHRRAVACQRCGDVDAGSLGQSAWAGLAANVVNE